MTIWRKQRKGVECDPSAQITGPAFPQPNVSQPTYWLPTHVSQSRAKLWVVGAHGGAGETTLASLGTGFMSTGHSWPHPEDGFLAPTVLVARTNTTGLTAAQGALTQWANSGAGPLVNLLGLILIADAPGKLPTALRDLSKVVSGGAPRAWSIPWAEEWRFGDPTAESTPRSVQKLMALLESLAVEALAPASLDSTIRH